MLNLLKKEKKRWFISLHRPTWWFIYNIAYMRPPFPYLKISYLKMICISFLTSTALGLTFLVCLFVFVKQQTTIFSAFHSIFVILENSYFVHIMSFLATGPTALHGFWIMTPNMTLLDEAGMIRQQMVLNLWRIGESIFGPTKFPYFTLRFRILTCYNKHCVLYLLSLISYVIYCTLQELNRLCSNISYSVTDKHMNDNAKSKFKGCHLNYKTNYEVNEL